MGSMANRVRVAAPRSSGSATPLMKRTTARRVKPVASCSPTGRSPGCYGTIGRARPKSLSCGGRLLLALLEEPVEGVAGVALVARRIHDRRKSVAGHGLHAGGRVASHRHAGRKQ